MKKLTHAKGQTVLSSFDYTVRQDGKRTGVTESVVNDQTAATPRTSSRDVGFTYDDAGRLTKEDGKDGLGVSYENAWQYDAAGNRAVTTYKRATKEAPNTVASTTTIAAVYTGNDWLKQQTSTVATAGTTNATTTFYGYDRNGAQTNERVGAAGAVEVNEWQFDGTLASTVTQGQATGGSEFVYDAGGNRLKQRTKIGKPEAKEVRYLVDPNTSYAQVVQERDENNVLQARYAWEDGLAPLVMWRRTKSGAYAAFFYLCDGQDSVRQLSDAAGRVTDSYFYDAFGNALQGGSGDTPNSFRYTGQQLDASNNYYLRARYYNSGSGRFLSHDPVMGEGDDPISMHRYLYAANNGVNASDPSGEETLAGLGVALSSATSLRSTAAGVYQSVFDRSKDSLLHGPEAAFRSLSTDAIIGASLGSLPFIGGMKGSIANLFGKWKVRPNAAAMPEEALKLMLKNVLKSKSFRFNRVMYNLIAYMFRLPRVASPDALRNAIDNELIVVRSIGAKSGVWSKSDPGSDPFTRAFMENNPTEYFMQFNPNAKFPIGSRAAGHELMHLGAMMNGQKHNWTGVAHEIFITTTTTPETLIPLGAFLTVVWHGYKSWNDKMMSSGGD